MRFCVISEKKRSTVDGYDGFRQQTHLSAQLDEAGGT